ncbi:hypothetical protein [Nocardioides montaniterrae]
MLIQPNAPFRGHSRRKGHRRVCHGLFRNDEPGLTETDQFVRDLEALLLVLPPGAVFTHVTAARLAGWQLPALPEGVPYFAAVRGTRTPRRQGLVCSRLTHDAPTGFIRGLPVDSGEEILLRCARDLGQLDLQILVDSARRHGQVDDKRMRDLLHSRRPGVSRLREAWNRSDPKAESAGETVLRTFHTAMEVEVESQFEVYNDAGTFLGRGDLRLRGTTIIHEYDGAGHRDKRQHRNDLRRERAWASTPYRRNGFTLDDLLNHPAVVMDELDRLLDRTRDRRRLRRWKTLVEESLYSEAGRSRLVNRWARAMGVIEWSKTAS